MTSIVIIVLLCIILILVYLNYRTSQDNRAEIIDMVNWLESARNLISEETKRKVKHTKLYENLTDPDKIEEEMERGADIIEARQANRLHAPRPDAGPPAKVFRPKFSGRRASFWNPPRP